jgi:hypothetical protein
VSDILENLEVGEREEFKGEIVDLNVLILISGISGVYGFGAFFLLPFILVFIIIS